MKRQLRPEIRKAVSIITAVTGIVSFILMIGYVGSCDRNIITENECMAKVIPCLAITGISMFLNSKVRGV